MIGKSFRGVFAFYDLHAWWWCAMSAEFGA